MPTSNPSSTATRGGRCPLLARAVCEAMDVEIAPSNINNVRLKLKRLT
ncbi:hypothetical protein AB0M41_43890 [Streptomyces sp. NPDC051896]